jgi:hypothetical protein
MLDFFLTRDFFFYQQCLFSFSFASSFISNSPCTWICCLWPRSLCTIPHLFTTMAHFIFYVCKKGINLVYRHHCYNKQSNHLHIPQFYQSICIPQTSQSFDVSNSQLKNISTIQIIYMKYIRYKILYNPLIQVDLAHWVHSSRLYNYFFYYWSNGGDLILVTCSISFHGSNNESQSHLTNVLPPLSRIQCHKLKNIVKMVKLHKKNLPHLATNERWQNNL